MIVIHAGVLDASRGTVTFAADFASACDFARVALLGRFPARAIVLSLLCLTADMTIAAGVAVADQQLRDLSLASDFFLFGMTTFKSLTWRDRVFIFAGVPAAVAQRGRALEVLGQACRAGRNPGAGRFRGLCLFFPSQHPSAWGAVWRLGLCSGGAVLRPGS